MDFLVDDYSALSILPIQVKSGRDFTIHSALNNMVAVEDYHIARAVVLSNDGRVERKGSIVYMPVYYSMFIGAMSEAAEDVYF